MKSQCARNYLTILLGAALSAGCAAEIGDSCDFNVDCSPLGDRICDTSQFEGYCTVVGCDRDSCPDDAKCIRFYQVAFLSITCDPRTEDAVGTKCGTQCTAACAKTCSASEACCAKNNCNSDEICLSSGFCALRTQEVRYCMQSCDDDDDCRTGYECRHTGTRGAETVPHPGDPAQQPVKFCAQKS